MTDKEYPESIPETGELYPEREERREREEKFEKRSREQDPRDFKRENRVFFRETLPELPRSRPQQRQRRRKDYYYIKVISPYSSFDHRRAAVLF